MADSAENEENIQMPSEYLERLKRKILARVCYETYAQLRLCQQGTHRKTFKTAKEKKSKQNSNLIENTDSLPPAEVLDDIKLDKELDTLKNIFVTAHETFTKVNLDEENPYANLSKMIDALKETDNKVDILTNELQENKSLLKDLEQQLKKQHEELTERTSQKSQRVRDLRDELDKMQRIYRIEFKLVQEWENNRLAQVIILAEKKERLLMQKIEDLNRRIADEHRFAREVKSFRNNEISDLKEKIAYRKQKFQEENTVIEGKNLILSQKIAGVVKNHQKLRAITEQRKLFVAEYLQQKAEEQRLYEEQRYRINCAIHIQAWWRGIMVRKGLGPYRKKSKRKKAKIKNEMNK